VQASARKMKRDKREQLLDIENHNRNNLNQLMKQQFDLAQQLSKMINEIVILQKNVLAVINALKRGRLIDDFLISQELRAIEEMEKMKSEALIIGGNEDARREQSSGVAKDISSHCSSEGGEDKT